MAVKLNIPYETLVELVKQLPPEEQQSLITQLQSGEKEAFLSNAERIAAYHASISSDPINEAPSIRREDWYDDDGR